MASVIQWAQWRKEYLSGLKRIIDDAPYCFAKYSVEADGLTFDFAKAKLSVSEAIEKGYINTNDLDYFFKTYCFAIQPARAESNGESITVEEGFTFYQVSKRTLDEDFSAEAKVSLALFGLYLPLIRACYYVFLNHPLSSKTVLVSICNELGYDPKWETLRLNREDMFCFLRKMTPYGLNKLFTDLKCSTNYFDDLIDAIQEGDYEEFKSLCRDGNIELTEVAEIAGYIQETIGKAVADFDNISVVRENKDYSKLQQDNGETHTHSLLAMMGFPADDTIDFMANLSVGDELINKLFPNASEEDGQMVSSLALSLGTMYPYIEFLDNDELDVVERLLNNPLFDSITKVAQLLFAVLYKRFPNAVELSFTTEEQNVIAESFFNSEDDKEREAFALPADYFDLPLDRSAGDEYFDVEYAVEKGGTKRFTRLLNYIASQGFIEYSNRSKQQLAYILTGRWKPADYQGGEPMAWHDYGHEGKELCYIIKSLVTSDQGKKATKYDKMHKLFKGPNWSKNVPDKDQGNNAQKKFKEALNDLYPDLCKL